MSKYFKKLFILLVVVFTLTTNLASIKASTTQQEGEAPSSTGTFTPGTRWGLCKRNKYFYRWGTIILLSNTRPR